MKKLITLAFLLILNNSYAEKLNDTSNNESLNFKELLIGTWSISTVENNDFSYEETTYTLDGRKCTIAFSTSNGGPSDPRFYLSKWEVTDDILVITVEKSSTKKYVPPGVKIVNRILRVNKNELAMFMIAPLESDETSVQYRAGKQRKGEICDIVEKHT